MTMAIDAFIRGAMKAYRLAGIPVSPQEEAQLKVLMTDAQRGAKQDVSDIRTISKTQQGAGRQRSIDREKAALQDNMAARQMFKRDLDLAGKGSNTPGLYEEGAPPPPGGEEMQRLQRNLENAADRIADQELIEKYNLKDETGKVFGPEKMNEYRRTAPDSYFEDRARIRNRIISSGGGI